MKRKILTVFIAFACAFCLAFGAVGCNPEDGSGVNENQTAQGGQDGGSAQGGQNEDGQGTGGGSGGSGSGSGGHKHNFGEFVPEQPATCTEAGRKGYYFCADCNKYFDVQKNELGDLTIPAKGHSYISVCDQTEHWQICTVCGEEEAHTAHGVTDGVCDCGYVEKYTAGLEFTEIKENGVTVAYSVSNGTATDSEIFIPSFHENLPVTAIGEKAFEKCHLTSVTIGNGVASIGDWAFCNCDNLTNIQIPDSMAAIGSNAFISCATLTDVYIKNIGAWCNIYFCDLASNPFGLERRENYNLYLNNQLISDVVIPQSVENIPAFAFRSTSLTSIKIPDSVTSIGSNAFSNCTNLTNIQVPDSLISIGMNVFLNTPYYNNQNNWSNGVFYMGNYLLRANESLSGNYAIRQGVNLIADGAFGGCSNLTNIQIPDSVSFIGSNAFAYCASLTNIKIPDGVTSIGSNAFVYCVSLTNIKIPDSVSFIGNGAFGWCTAQIIWGDNPSVKEIIAFSGYKGTSITIPDGITSIGDEAFSNCTNLETIKIPNGVTHLGEKAFYSCAAEIIWGDNPSIKEIGKFAFMGYKGKSITIPDGVTSIGYGAFDDCINFKSINIPDGITSIGYGAFEDCASLENVNIGSGVTYLGNYAFRNCSSLESVNFSEPGGWYITLNSSDTGRTDIPSEDLQNPETAAGYLKNTYFNYYWHRETA